MSSARKVSVALDQDIDMAHERFVIAMKQRVPDLPLESKERYFAVLSLLVGKLEIAEKNLRTVLEEMMVEGASLLMEELSSR